MPNRSQAYHDFKRNISVAETLIKREKQFSDPPASRNFKIVQGLRGGAAVLMVAAFENYLKEVIEERLFDFTSQPLKFNPTKLPEEVLYHNLSQTLERSLKGPFNGNPSKADKIVLIKKASQVVVEGIINSLVFSEVARSNPNSKKVRELFKCLGIPDIFSSIKIEFDKKWGTPTAGSFIPDTLDSILQRRHEVAHTAIMLNVSRLDLEFSVKFLKLLAELCDKELNQHLRKIFIK